MASKFNLANLSKLLSTEGLSLSNTRLSKHEIHKNVAFIEQLYSWNNRLGTIMEYMATQGQLMQISWKLLLLTRPITIVAFVIQ